MLFSFHYVDTFHWELASANWDLTMSFHFLIRLRNLQLLAGLLLTPKVDLSHQRLHPGLLALCMAQ